MCEEMGRGERHFNELQAGYRKLASSWVIALFGAFAFLFFPTGDSNSRLGTDAAMIFTLALALVALAGIAAIWILDLLVYHRLLLAYFFAGQKLENDYSWLPRVRNNMSALNSSWPVLKKVVLFYAVCLAVCIGIGFGSLIQVLVPTSGLGTFGAVAVITFVLAVCALYWALQVVTKTDVEIREELEISVG